MTISMVLFWGAVIFGIVVLVRYFGRGGQQTAAPQPPQAPERLLAERFACGEIDEEEYQRRLAALQGAVQATNGQAAPLPGRARGEPCRARDSARQLPGGFGPAGRRRVPAGQAAQQ